MHNQFWFFISAIFTLFLWQFFHHNLIFYWIFWIFIFYFLLKFFYRWENFFWINKKIFLSFILFIIFWWILAFWRIFFLNLEKPENHISNFLDLDEKIFIEWRICWEVDKRIHKTNYVFCTEKIWEKNTEWKILISTSLYPEYKFWDFLRIEWKMKTPFEEEDFSYKNFLLMNWIYWVVYYGKIEKINNFIYSWSYFYEKKFLFFQKIFHYKKIFLEKIEEIYPAPHSAFLAWLLIWDRKWLPENIKEDFQKNWLAHIVAISWYNITIIIILVSWLFFFLPRKIWIILSSIFIILFTIFVGWTSAVVRASVMWILWLLALYYWREKNVLILILTAIFLMSLWNPMLLWWDVWFHLSILAVFWIVYLVKIFEKFTEKIKNFFWIKEIILLTISASLMTFPLVSYHFWIVSLISPIANLFVAPLTPLAMLFWFLSVVFWFFSDFKNFWIFYFFQELFWFLTYSILDLALKLSHFFAEIKFSYFEYQVSLFFVIFCFLVLWIIFFLFRKNFN